jgi:carboxymethylenebutenolidase
MPTKSRLSPAMVLVILAASAAVADEKPKPNAWTGGVSEAEFKAMHQLASGAVPELHGTAIDLAGGKAYLSLPPNAKAPLPAVLVVHEWWGLNDHVKHWADRLATSGYAALAVDLYAGKVAATPDEAMAAMKAVDPEQARAMLLAGHAFLKQDARVKAAKRGSIGWCFGGAQSLQLALAAPDLDACVMYYGHPVLDSKELSVIKAPLLGIFGNLDASIPPATVDEFDKALTAGGVEHEILRYDAVHAFANPSNPRYDEKAAGDAWEKVQRFFAANLR